MRGQHLVIVSLNASLGTPVLLSESHGLPQQHLGDTVIKDKKNNCAY